ncbi:MAG: STAS domain-containing protein [Ruminococcaceae bacterium]|nr:STAS domain-containing protein [Oscillospiraceae bacterium]
MDIAKEINGSKMTVKINGRLDTNSAPELEREVMENIEGIEELVFDLSQMPYTSSAGLRVFLKAQKQMNKQGNMCVIGACEDVLEVFEITGFSDIINIT